METLSISKLCGIPEENFSNVMTLNSFVEDKKPSIGKDIERILLTAQEGHDHKLNLYKSILRKCVDQMKVESAIKKTDLFFYVDDNLYNNQYYNRDECIDYLIMNLRNYYLDVQLLPHKIYGKGPFSKSVLFISWKYTEYHKKSQFFSHTNQNIQ